MVKKIFSISALSIVALFASVVAYAGLFGYSSKSNFPENIKSVYVAPVKSTIDLSSEISDKEKFRVYRPGIEVELTNAIINRFVFDGNLKIAPEATADAVLEAKLTDFKRDALRYSDGDDVQEYRLSVNVSFILKEIKTGKIIAQDSAIVGDADFFLAGPRAITEDEAAAKAVEDAAKRIIDKTIEVW